MQLVQNKKTLIIRFAILYLLTVLLLFVLFSAFNSKPSFDDDGPGFVAEQGNSAALASVLSREEELRLNYFQLLLSDEELLKAKAAGQNASMAGLQEKSNQRLQNFDSLLKAYTSTNTYEPEITAKEMARIRGFFTAMLEQRKLVIAVPAEDLLPDNLPGAGKTASTAEPVNTAAVANPPAPVVTAPDPDEIGMLKKQVSEREQELEKLEARLKVKDQQITALGKQVQAKTVVKQVKLKGSASEVADLERRNANLVKGINVLQTQVGMLQKNYNLLKAENARLQGK